ncbi:hypothetical protein PG995_014394 [Apiospora arundinis]
MAGAAWVGPQLKINRKLTLSKLEVLVSKSPPGLGDLLEELALRLEEGVGATTDWLRDVGLGPALDVEDVQEDLGHLTVLLGGRGSAVPLCTRGPEALHLLNLLLEGLEDSVLAGAIEEVGQLRLPLAPTPSVDDCHELVYFLLSHSLLVK